MESNLRNILRERIHAEGFEIVYDPPGNEMCFYDAAGYLLRESGQNLKERVFQYLRENRCDVCITLEQLCYQTTIRKSYLL